MTGKEKLNDLMTEFDEMGYCPTTLCNDPDAAAKQWQKQVFEAIAQTEREVRKETAKEILQTLYNNCYEFNARLSDEVIGHIIPTKILRLAEKYGVEVEE